MCGWVEHGSSVGQGNGQLRRKIPEAGTQGGRLFCYLPPVLACKASAPLLVPGAQAAAAAGAPRCSFIPLPPPSATVCTAHASLYCLTLPQLHCPQPLHAPPPCNTPPHPPLPTFSNCAHSSTMRVASLGVRAPHLRLRLSSLMRLTRPSSTPDTRSGTCTGCVGVWVVTHQGVGLGDTTVEWAVRAQVAVLLAGQVGGWGLLAQLLLHCGSWWKLVLLLVAGTGVASLP